VNTVTVKEPKFLMSSLFPGRNYSISIQAVSNGVESDKVAIFQATSKCKVIAFDTWRYIIINDYLQW